MEQLPTPQLPPPKVFDPWAVLWSGALGRSRYLDPSKCRVCRLPYLDGPFSVYSATSPLSKFFLVSGNHKLIKNLDT